jgi:hypothetical protein
MVYTSGVKAITYAPKLQVPEQAYSVEAVDVYPETGKSTNIFQQIRDFLYSDTFKFLFCLSLPVALFIVGFIKRRSASD